MTGLNPHCESILKNNEDDKILKPIIDDLKKKRFIIDGPFSADTIFLKQNRIKFDVILGMYHDQVLAPLKTLFEYDATNITMGLPFLRVSPDHGPNEIMFKKNKSNPLSLINSLNFLDKKWLKQKKSLGQNFLIDDNILKKITNIIDIENKDILEVGPGTGNLTSALLKKKPKKITVIEKDDRLAKFLSKKFSNKLEVINEDILKIDENSLNKNPLIVFGNLPYNISTEILCKWILNLQDKRIWFQCLILMFQKEVADRIISKFDSKDYGRLSILANWRLDIVKFCDIKSSSFFPKPKIDSSLLIFKPKKDFFKFKDAKNLEKITRIFFMHRRKMIKKPYNQLFNGNIDLPIKLKISLNLRPQNLDFQTYYKLTKEYENLRS